MFLYTIELESEGAEVFDEASAKRIHLNNSVFVVDSTKPCWVIDGGRILDVQSAEMKRPSQANPFNKLMPDGPKGRKIARSYQKPVYLLISDYV